MIGRELTSFSGTRFQGRLRTFVPRPTRSLQAVASLTVKESGTGVEFPLVERLWYVSIPQYVEEIHGVCDLVLFVLQGWRRYEMHGSQQSSEKDCFCWN